MFGKTTKKVQNRKERYILDYTFLTQAQVNSILSQFELGSALTFQCTDTNMPIGPTTVLMDIQGRDYPPSGEELREDMQIILTEVT